MELLYQFLGGAVLLGVCPSLMCAQALQRNSFLRFSLSTSGLDPSGADQINLHILTRSLFSQPEVVSPGSQCAPYDLEILTASTLFWSNSKPSPMLLGTQYKAVFPRPN